MFSQCEKVKHVHDAQTQHIYVNLQISLLSGEVLQVQQEDGTFSADGSWGETKTTIYVDIQTH